MLCDACVHSFRCSAVLGCPSDLRLPTTRNSHISPHHTGSRRLAALRAQRSGDGEIVREVQMEDRRVEVLVNVELPSIRWSVQGRRASGSGQGMEMAMGVGVGGDLVELGSVVFDAILVEGLPHVEDAPHLLRVGPLPSVRLRVRIKRLARGRSRVRQGEGARRGVRGSAHHISALDLVERLLEANL